MKLILVFLAIAFLSLCAAKPLRNNREIAAMVQEDKKLKGEIRQTEDPAVVLSGKCENCQSKDENASIQDITKWINKLPVAHQCFVAFIIVFVFGILLCDVAFYVWFFTSFRYRHDRCRSKHASNSYKVNDSKVDKEIDRIHSEIFGSEDDDEKLKELMKKSSKPRVTFADEKKPRKKDPVIIFPKLSKKLASILEDDTSSGSEICSGDEKNLLKEQQSSDSGASTLSTNVSPVSEASSNQSWFENPLFDSKQKIQQDEKQSTGGWKETAV